MNDEIKISTVDEYLKMVFQKTITSKNDDIKPQIFWFRGESKNDFKTPLVPNGYRVLANTFNTIVDDLFKSDHVKQLEQNISAEFDRKALPYIISKRIDNTAWNRYFLMQHYNIYTRLLDWTENAILALFFAISDNTTIDAKVWILKPFFLNSYTIKTFLGTDKDCMVIPPISDSTKPQELINEKGDLRLTELTRRYLRMDFDPKETNNCTNVYYPLAIYPSFLDERMSAQKTCFTIFGNKINGLRPFMNGNEKILDSITIAGGSKEKMLNELRLIGIDFDSIYPDLDGLGRSIIGKYKREFYDNSETIIHIFDSINIKTKKKPSR